MSDQPANARYEVETRGDQRRLIASLVIAGQHTLSAPLAQCSPESSCLSGACQFCGASLQLALLDLGQQLIRAPSIRDHRDRVQTLTIAPALVTLLIEPLDVELGEALVEHLCKVRALFAWIRDGPFFFEPRVKRNDINQ